MRVEAGVGQLRLDGSEEAPENAPSGPGLGKVVDLPVEDLAGSIEALVLASEKPIAAARLARLTRTSIREVREAAESLVQSYGGRGIELVVVAGGYQYRTASRFAPLVRELIQQKPARLTRAQIEVLSIVAYRQPVTKPELEEVRGVDSGAAIKALLDRDMLQILGKKEEPGRPLLYGTTPDFLELFSLEKLSDLPTLQQFTELSDESRDIFERKIGDVDTGLSDAGLSGRRSVDGGEAEAPPDAAAAAHEDASDAAEASGVLSEHTAPDGGEERGVSGAAPAGEP